MRRARTFAAGLVLLAGGMSAGLLAPTSAAAAEPILVGDCSTSIQGAPGTPISLSPAAVLDPVLSVVRAVPLLGPGLADGVGSAVRGMGNVPLGVVPNADSTISGGTIAAAAAPRIKSAIQGVPLIGPVLNGIVADVQGALTSGCRIAITVVNAAAAPVQDGAKQLGQTAQEGVSRVVPGAGGPSQGGPGTPKPGTQPGSTPGGADRPGGVPGATPGGSAAMPGPSNAVVGGLNRGAFSLYDTSLGRGRSPMSYYASIPAASPGLFAPSPAIRYGGAVPGYSPQFGILGTDADSDGVQAAGHAEVLDPVRGGRIAFPVLFAVLALSGVTAALVRTWVLRRTTA